MSLTARIVVGTSDLFAATPDILVRHGTRLIRLDEDWREAISESRAPVWVVIRYGGPSLDASAIATRPEQERTGTSPVVLFAAPVDFEPQTGSVCAPVPPRSLLERCASRGVLQRFRFGPERVLVFTAAPNRDFAIALANDRKLWPMSPDHPVDLDRGRFVTADHLRAHDTVRNLWLPSSRLRLTADEAADVVRAIHPPWQGEVLAPSALVASQGLNGFVISVPASGIAGTRFTLDVPASGIASGLTVRPPSRGLRMEPIDPDAGLLSVEVLRRMRDLPPAPPRALPPSIPGYDPAPDGGVPMTPLPRLPGDSYVADDGVPPLDDSDSDDFEFVDTPATIPEDTNPSGSEGSKVPYLLLVAALLKAAASK